MVTGICCVGLLFLEGDFGVVSGFKVVGDACFFHGCVVDECVELAWFEGELGFGGSSDFRVVCDVSFSLQCIANGVLCCKNSHLQPRNVLSVISAFAKIGHRSPK